MQGDYGDGDGTISQIRSSRNEEKKISRGKGNKRKLKMAPGLPDNHLRRKYCTLQFTIKDASKSGKTHSLVFQDSEFH